MYGARVAVMRPSTGDQGAAGSSEGRPNQPTLWRRARADGSYASANDPRVLAGLGDAAGNVRVRVVWPNGVAEDFGALPIDRWAAVRQGTGSP